MSLHFKPLANPILILSDGPEQLTGLARVGRDIASLLVTLPQFRVGYLGRAGVGRRKFPWTSYSFPEIAQWGEDYIAHVWNDFSGGEDGIVWSNYDASRMLWLTQPQHLAGSNPDLARFLGPDRTFEKWGYLPVDSTGPDGVSLPIGIAASVLGYDRVCAASEWGAEVVQKTRPSDWIPHGIWMDRFRIMPAREDAGHVRVGCVMANQSRKDFPVAFETAAYLKKEYGVRLRFWLHTDTLVRYWNVYALAADYGLQDCLEVTLDLSDTELAARYSACACTILPSGGEGFGFPIAESMACGTACIVTDYAAGQEIVEKGCRVAPVAYRVDTAHNCLRAVLSGERFAAKAAGEIEKKRQDWEYRGEELRGMVEHLDWNRLASVWTRYFLEGIRA